MFDKHVLHVLHLVLQNITASRLYFPVIHSSKKKEESFCFPDKQLFLHVITGSALKALTLMHHPALNEYSTEQ